MFRVVPAVMTVVAGLKAKDPPIRRSTSNETLFTGTKMGLSKTVAKNTRPAAGDTPLIVTVLLLTPAAKVIGVAETFAAPLVPTKPKATVTVELWKITGEGLPSLTVTDSVWPTYTNPLDMDNESGSSAMTFTT